MNGAIIYLFGFAGCGKLTIANAIRATYDCLLVDNHHINNVILALIDTDGKSSLPRQVWENVARVRTAVFDTVRRVAKPGRSFIFTNELWDGEEGDQKIFLEVAEIARERGALFLPVRLVISADELARRVVSPGRAELFKERDAEAARRKVREQQVLKPQAYDYLELDISSLTPEEAAEHILRELKNRQRSQPDMPSKPPR